MDEQFEKDLLFAEADLFARFIEGKLSPELTREMEAFLEVSPEAQRLAEFSRATLAEQESEAELDWPERLHAITGRTYDDTAWLPRPLLDDLEVRRQQADAAGNGPRALVDEFEIENGHLALYWQGQELVVELHTTNTNWWHATVDLYLLTPDPTDRAETVVNAHVTLEIVSETSDRYIGKAVLAYQGPLTAETQLFVSAPHLVSLANLATERGAPRPEAAIEDLDTLLDRIAPGILRDITALETAPWAVSRSGGEATNQQMAEFRGFFPWNEDEAPYAALRRAWLQGLATEADLIHAAQTADLGLTAWIVAAIALLYARQNRLPDAMAALTRAGFLLQRPEFLALDLPNAPAISAFLHASEAYVAALAGQKARSLAAIETALHLAEGLPSAWRAPLEDLQLELLQ